MTTTRGMKKRLESFLQTVDSEQWDAAKVKDVLKTLHAELEAYEFENEANLLQGKAQARLAALKEAWQLTKTSEMQIAGHIFKKIEEVNSVLKEQRKEVQKQLLCDMLMIPKESIASAPISDAYGSWSETTGAQEFSELPTRKIEVPNLGPRINIAEPTDFNEDLIPFVRKTLRALPEHQRPFFLSKLSALTDFRPPDKKPDEFLAEMSARLGIEITAGETGLDTIAKKLKAKEES